MERFLKRVILLLAVAGVLPALQASAQPECMRPLCASQRLYTPAVPGFGGFEATVGRVGLATVRRAGGGYARGRVRLVRNDPAHTPGAVHLHLYGFPSEGEGRPRTPVGLSRMPGPLQMLLQQEPSTAEGSGRWARRLAVIQGSYYTATGLWPLIDIRSFERVTGPKTDDWLVKTVGAMIAVLGGALLVSGLGDGPSSDLRAVAAGSAAVLAVVDITYVARGRISRIYLLDAAAEVALASGWALTLRR